MELSFMADFSNGVSVGNYVENIPTISVAPSEMFAEPFIAQGNNQAMGVFLDLLSGVPHLGITKSFR